MLTPEPYSPTDDAVILALRERSLHPYKRKVPDVTIGAILCLLPGSKHKVAKSANAIQKRAARLEQVKGQVWIRHQRLAKILAVENENTKEVSVVNGEADGREGDEDGEGGGCYALIGGCSLIGPGKERVT